MKTIQKWFELLAGISQGELDRTAIAAEVFTGQADMDIDNLQLPACWRRSCKIRTHRA